MIAKKGSKEPEWVTATRYAYYAHRRRLEELESRISQTESGLRWLMKVKELKRD